MLPNHNARVRREPGGISGEMAETRICVMSDGRVTGVVGHERAECMVRRVNARGKFRMKESLRQCIRPLGGEFFPGLDEIRRVPVL
jgi:hypothetical protein